jgi:hypothetical protein
LSKFKIAQPSDAYWSDDDGQNKRCQHGINGTERNVTKHIQHAHLIAQRVQQMVNHAQLLSNTE